MRNGLLVLALLVASNAAAQDLHVHLHGLSYHPVRTQADGSKWNEQNIGVGLRYQIKESLDTQVGVYKNSQFRTSIYAIATWLPIEVGVIRAGVFGGAVTGYLHNNGELTPAGGLAARWQGERLSVTTRFIPKHPKSASSAISVELGIKF